MPNEASAREWYRTVTPASHNGVAIVRGNRADAQWLLEPGVDGLGDEHVHRAPPWAAHTIDATDAQVVGSGDGDVGRRVVLRGRRGECGALDRLVEGVRAGRRGVLLLRDEAGVGKTALLDDLLGRCTGCRVARAVGVPADTELEFAGLQQLCGPLLDRFLVGLGVLGLLAEAAEERPVVCLVDDAHWLDRASAQALAFVARRPLAEAVAVVFAVREPGGQPDLSGLPELVVAGLDEADAQLGLGVRAAAPAEAVGLLELGARVRFRHPLMRSAVHGAATLEERQRAHQALAAAAAFLERAAALTPEPGSPRSARAGRRAGQEGGRCATRGAPEQSAPTRAIMAGDRRRRGHAACLVG